MFSPSAAENALPWVSVPGFALPEPDAEPAATTAVRAVSISTRRTHIALPPRSESIAENVYSRDVHRLHHEHGVAVKREQRCARFGLTTRRSRSGRVPARGGAPPRPRGPAVLPSS